MALPKFGKRSVRRAELIIRKAGDGLSEALKFEPVALNHGDEIYVVLRAVVVDVQHPAEDRKDPGDSDLIRRHIVDTQEITLVAETDVEPMLKAAADRIHEFRLAESLAEEQASGITRLPGAVPGVDPAGTTVDADGFVDVGPGAKA